MSKHGRGRCLVAVLAALCLALAACGSRLDHSVIADASSRLGTGTGAGEALAGRDGVAAGTGTGNGQAGTTAGPGQGTADGAGPGQAGAGPGGATGNNPAGPDGKAGGGPIVIGTHGGFTITDALGPAERAMKAWTASVNSKGGLGGRQVKLIVMDTGGDPGRAKSQMQQLVEQHNVVAVVGVMSSPATMNSWKGYVESKGVPIIGGTCTPEWSQPSPVLFRQCATSEATTFGAARIGAQYGNGKNFGGLFCTESDVCSEVEHQLFAGGDARKAGLNPVYSGKISLFQTDFTPQCLQARNNGVQLLMVIADPGTVARVAASCNRQNYRPQFLQPGATAGGDMVTKPGLGDMLLAPATFPFAGLSTPAFQEFDAAWKRYGGGGLPTAAASLAWSSAKLFERAAMSAGGDISRARLLKALRGLKGETLGGLTVPLTFGPQGVANVDCVFYMRGNNGAWAAPDGGKPYCW